MGLTKPSLVTRTALTEIFGYRVFPTSSYKESSSRLVYGWIWPIGAALSVTVNAKSTCAGSYTGLVTIVSSDPFSSPYIFPVKTAITSSISSLTASTTNADGVHLTWSEVFGRSDYDIWRGSTPSDLTNIYMNWIGTSYVDTNAVPGITNYYKVSCYSGEISPIVPGVRPITRLIALMGALDFSLVATNTSATRTLTISNAGNSTLTFTNIVFPSGFSGNWTSGLILAGKSTNVTVTFSPTAATSYGGTVTIVSDATGGPCIHSTTLVCLRRRQIRLAPNMSGPAGVIFRTFHISFISQETL